MQPLRAYYGDNYTTRAPASQEIIVRALRSVVE